MQFESERHTRVLANVSAMEAATPVATPKTNSSGTKNSRPNFFLMAALQLMDVHHTTVLQPQGALLSGYFKKAKDAPIPLFTQKYVVCTYGALSYSNDQNSPRRGGHEKIFLLF